MRIHSAVFFCWFLALEIPSSLFFFLFLGGPWQVLFNAIKISIPSPQWKWRAVEQVTALPCCCWNYLAKRKPFRCFRCQKGNKKVGARKTVRLASYVTSKSEANKQNWTVPIHALNVTEIYFLLYSLCLSNEFSSGVVMSWMKFRNQNVVNCASSGESTISKWKWGMNFGWQDVGSWKEIRLISVFLKKKKSEIFQWPQEISPLAFLYHPNFDFCASTEFSHTLLEACISANSPTWEKKEQHFSPPYLFPEVFIKE